MNLQAKKSMFRSRKSQQRKHQNRTDLATTFLAQLLRTKRRVQ